MKKFLSIILTIVIIVSAMICLPTATGSVMAGALSASEIKTKLDSLIAQYPAGSSHSYKSCWYFVKMLSNNIFGCPIPSQPKNEDYDFYLVISETDWEQIGTTLSVRDGNININSLK